MTTTMLALLMDAARKELNAGTNQFLVMITILAHKTFATLKLDVPTLQFLNIFWTTTMLALKIFVLLSLESNMFQLIVTEPTDVSLELAILSKDASTVMLFAMTTILAPKIVALKEDASLP